MSFSGRLVRPSESKTKGVPHAGQTSVPKLAVPQALQVLMRGAMTRQASSPAPMASTGRRRAKRVSPPSRSRRNLPAGPGRRSNSAARTTQNQGKEERCIQRWKREFPSIHRSQAARTSIPAQPISRVVTIQRAIPPSSNSRGIRVKTARPTNTGQPMAAERRRKVAKPEGRDWLAERTRRSTTPRTTSRHPAPFTRRLADKEGADGPPRCKRAIVTLKHWP
jgi:hypothetical protein